MDQANGQEEQDLPPGGISQPPAAVPMAPGTQPVIVIMQASDITKGAPKEQTNIAAFFKLSIFSIIAGSLSLSIELCVMYWNLYVSSEPFEGPWPWSFSIVSGSLSLLSGSFGAYAAKHPSQCAMIGTMVSSILVACLGGLAINIMFYSRPVGVTFLVIEVAAGIASVILFFACLVDCCISKMDAEPEVKAKSKLSEGKVSVHNLLETSADTLFSPILERIRQVINSTNQNQPNKQSPPQDNFPNGSTTQFQNKNATEKAKKTKEKENSIDMQALKTIEIDKKTQEKNDYPEIEARKTTVESKLNRKRLYLHDQGRFVTSKDGIKHPRAHQDKALPNYDDLSIRSEDKQRYANPWRDLAA